MGCAARSRSPSVSETTRVVADAERRGIERALHEGVQQDLVGLAANLEVAARSVESDPAAARALLDELQHEARRALTEMQELANRISFFSTRAGWPEHAAASREGVPVRIDVDVRVTVPPEIAGAVYFCVLDSLSARRPALRRW